MASRAGGSTSCWSDIGRAATRPWSHAHGARTPPPPRPVRRSKPRSSSSALSSARRLTTRVPRPPSTLPRLTPRPASRPAPPAASSLLSDNAAVFTGRSRRGKVLLELELARLGIQHKHSSTYHPQTCGKVERLHQTLKRFLAKQPAPASISDLQRQLDAFRDYYNQR